MIITGAKFGVPAIARLALTGAILSETKKDSVTSKIMSSIIGMLRGMDDPTMFAGVNVKSAELSV